MKLEFKVLKPPLQNISQLYSIVFIDYESLFISFIKQYSMPPMFDPLIAEIKQNGKIMKIYVFADFTKPELSMERNRVRTVTSNIGHLYKHSVTKSAVDIIMEATAGRVKQDEAA